jgi:hypothetical protein
MREGLSSEDMELVARLSIRRGKWLRNLKVVRIISTTSSTLA